MNLIGLHRKVGVAAKIPIIRDECDRPTHSAVCHLPQAALQALNGLAAVADPQKRLFWTLGQPRSSIDVNHSIRHNVELSLKIDNV